MRRRTQRCEPDASSSGGPAGPRDRKSIQVPTTFYISVGNRNMRPKVGWQVTYTS